MTALRHPNAGQLQRLVSSQPILRRDTSAYGERQYVAWQVVLICSAVPSMAAPTHSSASSLKGPRWLWVANVGPDHLALTLPYCSWIELQSRKTGAPGGRCNRAWDMVLYSESN